jgi:hypothetical protein
LGCGFWQCQESRARSKQELNGNQKSNFARNSLGKESTQNKKLKKGISKGEE